MRIVRFDEEVSIAISEFGSEFSVGPLVGPSSRVLVQIIHLPAGGRIGRHVTPGPQLFGVVRGSGWVSGAEGKRRALKAGYAAVWEAGEEHEAASDGGLTAVSIEGRFEVWAVGVTREIVVTDYDPVWSDWFETLRAHLWPSVRDLAVRIDHVGSTAVPGLAGKPIIDVDIVVATEGAIRPVIDRLRELRYRPVGTLGVPGREAFQLIGESDLPAHHLYLVVEDNKAHLDHWLLRDLLRADPEARRRYGELKRRNAEVAGDDIDVYVAAKAALVAELLARAREERGLPPASYWVPNSGS